MHVIYIALALAINIDKEDIKRKDVREEKCRLRKK
jgi:hypothetical protein